MATIINNPTPERSPDLIVERETSSSSAGLLTGILVVVLVLVLIAFVGLPYIRSTSTYSTPGAPSTGGPADSSYSTSPNDYNYNTTNAASSTNYYNMSPASTSPY